ncbi:MAG TPA: DUF4279 domain-containing protein [Rhizomicrobium sp.]|jgi:hypothetical protein
MRVTDFSFSFRVSHPSADLAHLPERLGLECGRVWKAGEPRTNPKGGALPGVNRSSYCWLKTSLAPEHTLPQAIAAFLDYLRPHKALLDELHTGGGELELFVYWSSDANTGETFEPVLLRAMADMNMALSLDIYGSQVPKSR